MEDNLQKLLAALAAKKTQADIISVIEENAAIVHKTGATVLFGLNAQLSKEDPDTHQVLDKVPFMVLMAMNYQPDYVDTITQMTEATGKALAALLQDEGEVIWMNTNN